MRGTRRQLDFGRYLAVAAALFAVVVALFEPEGSRGLGLPVRLGFWLLHAFVGVGLLALVQRALVGTRPGRRLGPWGGTFASGLFGALLYAPLALGMERLFGVADEDAAGGGWIGALLDETAAVVPSVTAVWLVINLPWLLRVDFSSAARAADETGAATSGAAEPDDEPALLAQLPPALGRDLVALSSELQYLRVYTRRGETLILHGLAAAIEQLDPTRGMRVHRSHWIARDEVREVRRRGDGAVCLMSNGLEVPVSRRYRKTVLETFGERARYAPRAGRD